MGKFRYEDYRQPWETGPHWELKREFIEKYSDMFPEERLLCLAQAYSNVVLMNCSYPDPVMRQISLLSKPLQMRKRFQDSNYGAEEEMLKGQEKKVSEKIKCVYENSGRPFKQIKFCASEEQLSVSPDSTIAFESVAKQSESTHSLSIHNQPISVSNSTVLNFDQNQGSIKVFNSEVKENNLLESDNEQNILKTLGLEFIQNFVQEIRNFQMKSHSPLESISYAAQKLKVLDKICYDISLAPESSHHCPLYCSKVSISNCIIASEIGESKKKAKNKSAETAVDFLIKMSNGGASVSNVHAVNSAFSETMNDSFISNQSVNCIKEFSDGDQSVGDDMRVLQTLSEKIINTNTEEPAIIALKHITASLNMQNHVDFDVTLNSKSAQESEYICKFFIKNILISSGKYTTITRAKLLAVESGFTKLKNLSKYKILNGELKERESIVINESNSVISDANMKYFVTETNNFERTFILNKRMFDSSLRDAFMLVDNLALKPASQRNLRTMLSESASFCRKSFEYKFEEIPGNFPPSKKAYVIIAGDIVGSAIASTKDEAKIVACDKAVEMLRKKYYTLKVKNEYIDGYIISRNQVFDGESFSSGALTESNIGCKMLKSMGWTGGGLGSSGIAEPVEAQGHHSFGRGLGYGRDKSDLRLFKKRIESMLQDFSKTNTLSDLVFSKDFSKDERKEIHKIAAKYNLHTVSRGTNEDRFLTVRHKYKAAQVLQYLAKNGGLSSKFELIDASDKQIEL